MKMTKTKQFVFVAFVGAIFSAASGEEINVADCQRTFGCIRMPKSCSSSKDCEVLATYQRRSSDVTLTVSIRGGHEWIGIGFNAEVTNPMMGTRGFFCNRVGTNTTAKAFNATKHAPPAVQSLASASVPPADVEYKDGTLLCRFQYPYSGNSLLRGLDSSTASLVVMAWGKLNQGKDRIYYHGPKNSYYTKIDVNNLQSLSIGGGVTDASASVKSTYPLVVVVLLVGRLLLR